MEDVWFEQKPGQNPAPVSSTGPAPVASTTSTPVRQEIKSESSLDIRTPSKPILTMPIARLQVMVEVSEKYKSLFTQLLYIFQEMYDAKDKKLLFDVQPLTAFIRPEKGEGFKNFLNELRTYYNVNVKNSLDCRRRLIFMRSKFTSKEELALIDDALDLLDLPTSSEIQSDADFKFLGLQQAAKDIDTAIEIQELFIYLNGMFQPVDEKAVSNPPKSSSEKSSRHSKRR